ncbi:MAG: LmbE family N-acetylglucosaminyl deacetylase [Verrucomicrobiales bacterium]|jgi:LmbE family N-acetylglucosaminyl deacetylase
MANNAAVLAIFAHPDDIEFRAAGTLLRLREVGYDLYCLNVSSGNCGSMTMGAEETAVARAKEAQDAAEILGAHLFPSLAHDLEITYHVPLLRKIAACVREANPSIVLTHSPEDYMEDHMITARLAVTATFAKGIPNFVTDPESEAVSGDVVVYHAMPHGLHDPLRKPIAPDLVVDTTSVHATKRTALAAHRSQKDWLDQSQGMDSYLTAMDEESQAIARSAAGNFEHGEGWRRHLHLGFSKSDSDPLAEALGV